MRRVGLGRGRRRGPTTATGEIRAQAEQIRAARRNAGTGMTPMSEPGRTGGSSSLLLTPVTTTIVTITRAKSVPGVFAAQHLATRRINQKRTRSSPLAPGDPPLVEVRRERRVNTVRLGTGQVANPGRPRSSRARGSLRPRPRRSDRGRRAGSLRSGRHLDQVAALDQHLSRLSSKGRAAPQARGGPPARPRPPKIGHQAIHSGLHVRGVRLTSWSGNARNGPASRTTASRQQPSHDAGERPGVQTRPGAQLLFRRYRIAAGTPRWCAAMLTAHVVGQALPAGPAREEHVRDEPVLVRPPTHRAARRRPS